MRFKVQRKRFYISSYIDWNVCESNVQIYTLNYNGIRIKDLKRGSKIISSKGMKKKKDQRIWNETNRFQFFPWLVSCEEKIKDQRKTGELNVSAFFPLAQCPRSTFTLIQFLNTHLFLPLSFPSTLFNYPSPSLSLIVTFFSASEKSLLIPSLSPSSISFFKENKVHLLLEWSLGFQTLEPFTFF